MRLAFAGLVLSFLAAASAQGTRTWQQTSFEDFEKGTSHGVAIDSQGSLTISPDFQPVASTPSTYLWEVVADEQGNVFAAAGSPARVYRIAPDGRMSVIFAPTELQVQSIALGKNGLYAATSPDGKIYRIERNATIKAGAKSPDSTANANHPGDEVTLDPEFSSSVYFEPHTKYIWDLVLDPQGRLYAATGDQGQIFRITAAGQGSVFFKSDETHIRALRFDGKGNLIAGSDGTGLVYRIDPEGNAFVLLSTPKTEVTALTLDDAGNIYVAATGDKRAPLPAPPPSTAPITAAPAAAAPAAPSPSSSGNGSDVIRIAPDGSPRRIFSTRDEIIYTLALDSAKHLLVGTGNKGKIYALKLDGTGSYLDLLKASANQVTSMAAAANGSLYACTGNLGKVFRIASKPPAEASYESDVFDAKIFSQWGRLEVRSRGNVSLAVRSGNVENPDRNWSNWKNVPFAGAEAGVTDIPAARFVQWKAVMHEGMNEPPVLERVLLNFRTKNVAPVVDDIVVLPGMRFPSAPPLPPGTQLPPGTPVPVPTAIKDKDSIGVRWNASDENDDALQFTLYYRGDNETAWKPLTKEPINERSFTFDSGLLPDGGYTLKIVASDAPAHTAADALSVERVSGRFEVDNTPPQIGPVQAEAVNKGIHVSFQASDSFSPIKRAEYSVDAGDWQYLEPVGLLSDSRNEKYDFNVPLTQGNQGGEHVVVVRVYDRYDNMAAAKAVVH